MAVHNVLCSHQPLQLLNNFVSGTTNGLVPIKINLYDHLHTLWAQINVDINCYFTCMQRVSNHQAVNVVVILLSFNPSTVSSSINALAAVTVEDIIRPHTNMSEKHLTLVSKGLSKCILSGFHWMICFWTLQTKNPTFDYYLVPGFLYGALCISMAGLSSIMGGMMQVSGSVNSHASHMVDGTNRKHKQDGPLFHPNMQNNIMYPNSTPSCLNLTF